MSPVTLPPTVPCASCDGSGRVWETHPAPGYGRYCPPGTDLPGVIDCDPCDGTGRVLMSRIISRGRRLLRRRTS